MIEDPALVKRVRAIYRTLGLPTRTGANKAKVLGIHAARTRRPGATHHGHQVPRPGCWRADTISTSELPRLLGLE